jgi:hypothetical protein
MCDVGRDSEGDGAQPMQTIVVASNVTFGRLPWSFSHKSYIRLAEPACHDPALPGLLGRASGHLVM